MTTVGKAEALAVLRRAREGWALEPALVSMSPELALRDVLSQLAGAANTALLTADTGRVRQYASRAAGLALFDRAIQVLEAGDDGSDQA